MTLLDDLKIRYKTVDDEIWVNLSDLSTHFLKTTHEFAQETVAVSWINPMRIDEAMFVRGMTEGMISIVTLLAQAGIEAEFHEKINTVEDLINTLKEKPNEA
jgi:hypothetical protein